LESDPLKLCRVCGEEKPRTSEYFYRQRDTGDGFTNRCKDCTRIYQKQLYGDEKKKKKRARNKRDWLMGKRNAQREEDEQKLGEFLRLLQRQGNEILERRMSKQGRTTLVRILRPDGEVKTIYLAWKQNEYIGRTTDGPTKAERQIAKRLQKSHYTTGRGHSPRVVQEDGT
jgi:16S rRNA G1207 methylase RsmC